LANLNKTLFLHTLKLQHPHPKKQKLTFSVENKKSSISLNEEGPHAQHARERHHFGYGGYQLPGICRRGRANGGTFPAMQGRGHPKSDITKNTFQLKAVTRRSFAL